MWPRLPVSARRKLREFQRAPAGADWISERVESRKDGSELLAYYFEAFFGDPETLAALAQDPLHRNALNLVAEVLELKGWDR